MALAAAVSAALAKNNSSNSQKQQQLAATLHQIALQQTKSKQQNMEIFEQLALAAALASQHPNSCATMANSNEPAAKRLFHTANLGGSFDYRHLSSAAPGGNHPNNPFPSLLTPQGPTSSLIHHPHPSSSLSFPNLPSTNHQLNFLNQQQHLLNQQLFRHKQVEESQEEAEDDLVVDDDVSSSVSKKKKQEQPTLLKFGHIVHVEEENENMLETELKNAAKINEIATKNLLYNSKSTTPTTPVTGNSPTF
jgi:hypothetical protein